VVNAFRKRPERSPSSGMLRSFFTLLDMISRIRHSADEQDRARPIVADQEEEGTVGAKNRLVFGGWGQIRSWSGNSVGQMMPLLVDLDTGFVDHVAENQFLLLGSRRKIGALRIERRSHSQHLEVLAEAKCRFEPEARQIDFDALRSFSRHAFPEEGF